MYRADLRVTPPEVFGIVLAVVYMTVLLIAFALSMTADREAQKSLHEALDGLNKRT